MSERKYVVLDLFVINAITSSDLDLYLRTAAILQLIKDKCHKIVLTPSLKKEYVARLKKLERSMYINDRLLKCIKQLLIDSEKVSETLDISYSIPVEIPKKDQPIIRAALAKGGNTLIITTDEKHLISNVKLFEFLKNHNIRILSLDNALAEIAKN